jgi:DNA invertase Pin-like site-specific DNA recombinase
MTKRKKSSKAAAELVRIRWDSMTPEERSEQARKRWQDVPEDIAGAFAELEREIIRERVKAGLRNARKRGKRLGRRPAMINVHRVRELAASGLSGRVIAKQVGVAEGTIRNILRRCAKNPLAPASTDPANPAP